MGEKEPNIVPWILLAEDDKLFTRVFMRFWQKSFPDTPVKVAASLVQVRALLGEDPGPSFAVLDLNLEDGSSQELVSELSCPSLLWSATPDPHCETKPAGREQMLQAISRIAKSGGLGAL